jgi:hypothetical protein
MNAKVGRGVSACPDIREEAMQLEQPKRRTLATKGRNQLPALVSLALALAASQAVQTSGG